MDCTGQCHGCAYKTGAAANLEPHNLIRGFFAAMGGFPFFCHESLGWTPDRDGYPDERAHLLGISKKTLISLGALPEAIDQRIAQVRRDARTCGGWRAAVAKLRDAGWYTKLGVDVRNYRRQMAKLGSNALDDYILVSKLKMRDWRDAIHPENPLGSEKSLRAAKREAYRSLRMYFEFFIEDAKEQGVDIRWLVGSRRQPRL